MKNMTRTLVVVLVAVLSLGLVEGSLWGGTGKTAAGAPSAGKGASLKLKKFKYIDRNGTGTEAFSLLIPTDWQFKGGIKWVLDNPIMPAVASFSVNSPDGATALTVFPNQSLFWTSNQMLHGMFPIGSKYFGAEVRSVASPEEALKKIILPRFLANVSGLSVVTEKDLPDLASRLGAGKSQPGVETFGNAAKIRIEYVRNGVPMEEEIFAVVEGFSFPVRSMQGMVKNTNWFVDYIFSFRAPRGRLDANSAMFKTMVMSFRVNPHWFSKYNQVVEYLIKAQIKQIHSVGELSRIISKTSEQMNESTMKQYEKRQDVYDGVSENFSEYMRNTEHYHNPFEDKEVELPSGYSHVWTNTSGEYIFSDSPSYNPNIGSNKNWEELQAK